MKPHDAFLDLDVVERHGMTPSPETACQVKKAGAEAIKRILKAVRKEHIPPGLDREALRIEIGQAYFSRVDLFEGSKAQKRVKRLRSMHKTADKLARLIKADRTMGVWIQGTLDRAHSSGSAPPALPMSFLPTPLSAPPKAPAITVVLEQLQLAIAIVEHHQKVIAEKWRKGHKGDPGLRGRRLTHPEWLAGIELPLVFERHFLRRAGRSRGKSGSGPPSGPMVEFISATMKELGLKYEKESIARAYNFRAPLRKERRRGDTLGSISRQI